MTFFVTNSVYFLWKPFGIAESYHTPSRVSSQPTCKDSMLWGASMTER